MYKSTLLVVMLLFFHLSQAKDSTVYLKVHFLYGSKPKKQFKNYEGKWFGGKLGGHVGVEGDSGKILNFCPDGSFHIFAHPRSRHSHFLVHDPQDF